MRITWQIEKQDIARVKSLLAYYKDHPMVRRRIECNLSDTKPRVSRSRFWRALITCLLTTQQKSGPGSAIFRFTHTRPFPLNYQACRADRHPETLIRKTIVEFGGIRRHETIAAQLTSNLRELNGGLWSEARRHLNTLRGRTTRKVERMAAEFFDDSFKGLGSKQSRNLLQILGLTRFEIPLDSRVAKWLNEAGFPVRITASQLSNKDYYGFVMDGVIQLCRASRVYPCVFDAAVFSSFDRDPGE